MPISSSFGPRWFRVTQRWGGGGRGPRRPGHGRAVALVVGAVVGVGAIGAVIGATHGSQTPTPTPTAATAVPLSADAMCGDLTQGWSDLQTVIGRGDVSEDAQQVGRYQATLQQLMDSTSADVDIDDIQISAAAVSNDLRQLASDLQSNPSQATEDFVTAAADYQNIDYVCSGAAAG